MRIFSAIVLLFASWLLMTGCAHNGSVEPAAERVDYEAPAPTWYTHPPEANASEFFAVGEGEDPDLAARHAVETFKDRWVSETVLRIVAERQKGEGPARYLDAEGMHRLEELLKEAPFSSQILRQRRLADRKFAVLVAIDRRASAAALKERVLRKLVRIEEGWHAAARANPLRRYKVASESYEKMRSLLPLYLAADRIDPYGRKMADRVEKGLPYFAAVAKRLKKSLRFCVEPVRVPALRLFARATEEGLKRQRLAMEGAQKASRDTLCVTVRGKLLHKRAGGRYEVTGTITLTLHEKYKKPIVTQTYRVRGVSEESGPAALEKAADALRKAVEKRFLLSV